MSSLGFVNAKFAFKIGEIEKANYESVASSFILSSDYPRRVQKRSAPRRYSRPSGHPLILSLSLFRSLLEVERLEMVPGVSCSFIPRKHLCADPIETPTRDEPTLNRPLTVCHRMHCKDFTSHFHACCEFSLFG